MKKYNLIQFIEKSNQIFNNKYNYDKTIFKNVDTKVIITCPIHGDFEQYPKHHLTGHECKKCSAIGNNNLSNDEFLSRAKIVHNDYYSYEKTKYIDNKHKVIITCPIHGDFEQLPFSHLAKHGCKHCGIIKNSINQTIITLQYFIEMSNKIFNNKYNYSLVSMKDGDRTFINVDIICPIHGKFTKNVRKHLDGEGCPTCGYYRTHEKLKLSNEEFLSRAKIVHNDYYSYEKTNYYNMYTKVIITCPNHGDFQQLASNHLKGKGCSKCTESKGEKIIRTFLEQNCIKYQQEKSFNNLKSIKNSCVYFDFYLPEYNICIEYDGLQHYKPIFNLDSFEITKRNDILKNLYCQDNNIILIRIPYWNQSKINIILTEEILRKFLLPTHNQHH